MLRIAQSFKDMKKVEKTTVNRFEEKDTFEVALDRLIGALSSASMRSMSTVNGNRRNKAAKSDSFSNS
jgi:hypothetical protein